MNTKIWGVALVFTALGLGAGLYLGKQGLLPEPGDTPADSAPAATSSEPEILYWVAPMDPNFRRDQPGKSPMGMDLVPVYAGEDNGGDQVLIDPAVVQNLGVRSATVERGSLWRRIDTVGYIRFDERKVRHVHLRTDGWIDKLVVKSDGERIEQGQLLMEVYSRDLVSAQEEYLQALRIGNESLSRASKDRLLALGMEEDQIREVTRTRKASQLVRVRARQSGIVSGLGVREGMYVKPDQELMTLADLSSVWLLVDVFERQADWVKIGIPAEMELPYYPGKVWEGKVEFIYPSIDPKTRTLRVRLRFDNQDEALKPDMYAKVRIYAGPKKDVLSIPREALIRTGHSQRVIIAEGEGRFSAREVTAGMESGDWVEIRDGLVEGESVVTSGQFLIDSEASLKASFERMGSGASDQQGSQSESSVSGTGVISGVNRETRQLTMRHDPIDALGWPAMTMDFTVDESIDLTPLASGMRIEFQMSMAGEGSYLITQIQVME